MFVVSSDWLLPIYYCSTRNFSVSQFVRNVREALNKSSARREQQTEADIHAIFFYNGYAGCGSKLWMLAYRGSIDDGLPLWVNPASSSEPEGRFTTSSRTLGQANAWQGKLRERLVTRTGTVKLVVRWFLAAGSPSFSSAPSHSHRLVLLHT